MLTLDVGCGRDKYPNAVGIDLRFYRGKRTCADVVGDGLHLPFRDDAFSMVVARQFIEHVDCCLFFREVRRVLKLDGVFIVDTPNAYFWKRFVFAVCHRQLKPSADHIHVFGEGELKNLFRLSGFRVQKVQYRGLGLMPMLRQTLQILGKKIEERLVA